MSSDCRTPNSGPDISVPGAAFCVGRTAATTQRIRASRGQPVWLANASPEVAQAEQRFGQLAREQMDTLRAERAVLASMLSDTQFTGEQVLAQVDKIGQNHATLGKSVGVHLANLQGILPAGQGRRLMSSCANSLQGSVQRRYRWRGGQGQSENLTGGRRSGGGRGAGYGRQYRGGRNNNTSSLDRRLQLTQEQSAWIRQQDPNFEEQCIVLLRPRLSQEQRDLLSSLCRGGSRTDGGLVSGGHTAIRDVMAGLLGEQPLASLL